MTSSPRWDRLAADLAAAGIDARIDSLPYAEDRHGRVVHGVSRSAFIRHPDGGSVEINDRYWAKNPDVWLGWEIVRIGADSITIGRPSRATKNRSEVVQAAREKLAASR